ncbi:hypothetical protein Ancab_012619 [Ancistrocladus abbreviatus]
MYIDLSEEGCGLMEFGVKTERVLIMARLLRIGDRQQVKKKRQACNGVLRELLLWSSTQEAGHLPLLVTCIDAIQDFPTTNCLPAFISLHILYSTWIRLDLFNPTIQFSGL